MDELCKAMEELLFFQICFCQFATTRNRRRKHISHIMYLFKSVTILSNEIFSKPYSGLTCTRDLGRRTSRRGFPFFFLSTFYFLELICLKCYANSRMSDEC